MSVEAPSALLTATMASADACAKAAIHSRDCNRCTLSRILDLVDAIRDGKPLGTLFCEEGARFAALILAAEREIAQAVRAPMRREVAS